MFSPLAGRFPSPFSLGPFLRPLGGGGGGPALPEAPIYEGQVATRTFFASNITAGQTQAMCRSFHFARDSITSLKLVFQDAVSENEAPSGATTTLEASIEYPEGVFTRVQFGGVNAGSVASGGTLVSDATAVTIPDGEKFWVRHYRQNASGFSYNLYAARNASGGDETAAGASVPNTVMGGAIASNIAFTVTPQAIIGDTRKPSVFLVGDSRVIGVGDDFTTAAGDTGEFARTIGPEFAYINAGLAGARLSVFSGGASKRLELASYCSHAAMNFGINDVTSGAALSSLTGGTLVALGLLSNGKDGIFSSTLPPVSTSTDNWATTVNQTTNANNTNRVSFNDFIRDQPDNLTAFWEHANAVESAPDSGLWAPNLTSDGTHENSAGYTKQATDQVIDTSIITRPPEIIGGDEADALFQRWNTSPDTATEAAYRTYIAALKTAGVWSKLDVLYVTAAPDVQAARINLKDPLWFALTRYNAPTFGAFDGFTGNGSSADLSTNWRPSRDGVNYQQNSASLFVFSADNLRSNSVLCGFAGGGVKAYINPWNSSQNSGGNTLNTSGLSNNFAPTDASGLFTLTRQNASSYDVYRNSSLLGSNTVASTGVPSNDLKLCSGSLFYDGTRTISAFGAGGGLSAGEVSDLSSATNDLLTALAA